MRYYLITGAQIRVCSTRPKKLGKGDVVVASVADIEKARLSSKRLLAIAKQLPSMRSVKVTNRSAAIKRLWAALEELPSSSSTTRPPRSPDRRHPSKQDRVIALLRRPAGVTVGAIASVTGWQPHTVRGMISGALKKKLGLAIVSEKGADGDRVYRIAKD
jgi:hypothetical protein